MECRVITWDDAKDRRNRSKHGLGFETAQLVFDDPLHVTRQDRVEEGEQRWQTIGMVGGVAVLLVAHTWQDAEDAGEHIRIISARRATKLERRIYEEIT
jgi:uncharacterized protein